MFFFHFVSTLMLTSELTEPDDTAKALKEKNFVSQAMLISRTFMQYSKSVSNHIFYTPKRTENTKICHVYVNVSTCQIVSVYPAPDDNSPTLLVRQLVVMSKAAVHSSLCGEVSLVV